MEDESTDADIKIVSDEGTLDEGTLDKSGTEGSHGKEDNSNNESEWVIHWKDNDGKGRERTGIVKQTYTGHRTFSRMAQAPISLICQKRTSKLKRISVTKGREILQKERAEKKRKTEEEMQRRAQMRWWITQEKMNANN